MNNQPLVTGSKNASQTALIEAETAIRAEVRKHGLDYMELSPVIRELLASIFIRGSIETIEKVKREQKKALETSDSI